MSGRCDPQNNMDCHYNGIWNRIMKKKMVSNSFIELQDKNDLFLFNHVIDMEYNGDRVNDLIVKFRDSAMLPINNKIFIKLIKKIDQAENFSDISKLCSYMIDNGFSNIVDICVAVNVTYPNVNVIHVSKPETTDHDLDKDDKFLRKIAELYDFASVKCSLSSSRSDFCNNVAAFHIASKDLDNNDEYGTDDTNSIYLENFLDQYDHGDFWKNILRKYTSLDSHINYRNPNYFKAFRKNLEKKQEHIDFLQIIKDYLIYSVVFELSEMKKTKKTNGAKYLMLFMTDPFGRYLQNIFEKNNPDNGNVKIVKDMFSNLRRTAKRMIFESDVFCGKTRDLACRKLDNIELIIRTDGHRESYRDFPELCDDFVKNLILCHKYHFKKAMSNVSKPADRKYLSINNDLFSFDVNAYYDPSRNIIYIPTGILAEPFVSPSYDHIENYGKIGCILGHEIMHSFDNSGSRYDQNGKLHTWWKKSDFKNYNIQLEKVVRHYSKITVDNSSMNELISLGENMADINGIKLSFTSFLSAYLPNIDMEKLTFEKKYLEKFFRAWAKIFRSNDHPKNKVSDVHAPNVVRVNAPLSHIDAYYQIFNVRRGHVNYIDRKDRCMFI